MFRFPSRLGFMEANQAVRLLREVCDASVPTVRVLVHTRTFLVNGAGTNARRIVDTLLQLQLVTPCESLVSSGLVQVIYLADSDLTPFLPPASTKSMYYHPISH